MSLFAPHTEHHTHLYLLFPRFYRKLNGTVYQNLYSQYHSQYHIIYLYYKPLSLSFLYPHLIKIIRNIDFLLFFYIIEHFCCCILSSTFYKLFNINNNQKGQLIFFCFSYKRNRTVWFFYLHGDLIL